MIQQPQQMPPQEWKKRVHNFFIPNPRQPRSAYVWLILGLLAVVLAIAAHNAFIAFMGLIGVIVGAVKFLRYLWTYWRGQPKATGQELDAWLHEKLQWLVNVGVNRLGVHPTELGPRGMQGDDWYLVFVGIPDGDLVMARARLGVWRPDVFLYIGWGEDGQMRLSRYQIMIVYKSNYRMPVYQCTLDIASGATITDAAQEYKLSAVEGMQTFSDRINVQANKQGSQAPIADQALHFTTEQVIKLMVSGREAISMRTGIASSETSNFMGVSQVDGLIAALREHLREHHFGVQGSLNPLAGGLPTPTGLPAGQTLGLPADQTLGLPASPHPARALGGQVDGQLELPRGSDEYR